MQYQPFQQYFFQSDRGFLTWLDVSVGQIVKQFSTRLGKPAVMTTNPQNGVVCLGHSKGTVTMWTPNVQEPVAKLLTHRQAVRAVAIDQTGNYMATAAVDRTLKIWDARNTFHCLRQYHIEAGASKLNFSGRGLLGVALGDRVQVFRDPCRQEVKYPYLQHKVFRSVSDMHFVPFEDVMGIGHGAGVASILVPGTENVFY